MKLCNRIGVVLILPLAAWGQGMVEYGVNAGRAAGAAGGLGRAGKSTSDVLNKTAKGMERATSSTAAAPSKGAKGTTAAATAKASAAAPATAAPAASAEATAPADQGAAKAPAIDPEAIPVGLDRAELFRRFGKPSTAITQQQGGETVEKCWYRSPGLGTIVVILKGGKVVSAGS